MQTQMFSVKKLDNTVRTSFRLPCSPYDRRDPVLWEKTLEYLRDLGVVFYRDEVHAEAVLIQPLDEDTTLLTDRHGFIAFSFACDLDISAESAKNNFRDIGVAAWEKTSEKQRKATGDDRAWLKWNKKEVILALSETIVETA